jgi:3-oxoacyl-[acyl-carrier-protein] synthase III
MEANHGIRIAGTGRAVPDKILSNEDLSHIVDTTDEWIFSRTGIKRRHVITEDQKNSDFASAAGRLALEDAGIAPEDLDFIIIATVTGDFIFPSTAVVVQEILGAKNATAWDISAACAGWLFGISQAKALLKAGAGKRALVIGSEMLTKITNWKDRSTCVLFGDGAGAVVLEACDPEDNGILASWTRTDGSLIHLLNAPIGGTAVPLTHENLDSGGDKITMAGREVFKYAVRNMGQAAVEALKQAGVSANEVDMLIPHQANVRIMDALAKHLDFPLEKVYKNIEEYGNTSAASIPIAFDEARRLGLAKPGDKILMVAFGGGLTWGSTLFQL